MVNLSDEVRKVFNVDSYYEVLMVSADASQDDIRRAYFSRSRSLHPDKTTDTERKEELKLKFQLLSDIYKCLANVESRSSYDDKFKLASRLCADSSLYEEVLLGQCQQEADRYHYECRCSGRFVIFKKDLASRDRNSNQFLIVDCDSCSNSIKIGLG